MSNIFLYYANICDYIRILFLVVGVFFVFKAPVSFIICYCVSALCDAIDGNLARAFNQCSRLGAVLDMVTDRAGTTILITALAVLYPTYAPICCLITFVDICSHWTHMYCSLLRGVESHKIVTNPILKFYYTRSILFTLCLANEATFVMWYIRYFAQTDDYKPLITNCPFLWYLLNFLLIIATPLCVVKNLINLVQWYEAAKDLVDYEETHRKPN
ncbi:CDP-diacylglycerol--inositol 3-phosphatidyltransferase, putative [Entamoeba invadens IP1]|uniref:CDP-diacylglycerol--inositol 3-phosphatidyltransferase n=1 Tax=Entamoeba invadens IP1 TaxID=370355 RepID=A0A0A1U316_ENTIV|nr:CDP-diacylglycerol--inositol 3-phosphatidyltransferase, putative [Entamoeba invadens IP1]ELP88456.1 CDP-diacylglycerol--inositol 3-phosphatidyltransferase, putative [Entamoeba invadens IP1]|eukprot:XP_004255227.1 CDP-diacylglycerol--inositol 3-phosphatidyltransferase, putative [Entamoeba invadens IP1]